MGNPEQAVELARESVGLSESEPPWGRAEAVRVLAECELALGNPDALGSFAEAARGFAVLPTAHGLALTVEGVGELLHRAGDAPGVARALGAAGRLRDDCGAVPPAWARERQVALSNWASRQTGGEDYRRLWGEGAEMAANPADILTLIDSV